MFSFFLCGDDVRVSFVTRFGGSNEFIALNGRMSGKVESFADWDD